MIVHRGIKKFTAKNPVVTVGIFDGVHLGHKYIIEKLVSGAENRNGESVLVSLWPHPREVLNQSKDAVKLITTLNEKIKVLSRFPIDHLVIMEFSKQFSELSYCDFIQYYLVEEMNIRHLIMGYNHRFGRNREGNVKKIRDCAEKFGFTVEQLTPFTVDGDRISSSLIRQSLMGGNIEHVNKCLGHPFFVSGRVTGGSRVGRSIGFPTANIVPDAPNKLVPGDGVYAVEAVIADKVYPGMLNIGTRPTVNTNKGTKTIEVHIFDFEKDIYDQLIEVRFQGRIRNEMKFGSVDELKCQLKEDKKVALRILSALKNI